MMTQENILLFSNMNMTRYTSIMRKVVLTMITLLTVGVGEMWGQIMFNNTTATGTSLSWAKGNVGQIITTDNSDTKQQWLLKDTGDGKYNFYNIGSEGNNFFAKNEANGWTMTFITSDQLATETYLPRGKFSINDLGKDNYGNDTYSIGTTNGLLGTDATASGSEVFGNKKTSANGIWTIADLCNLTITHSEGKYTITANSKPEGSTIYYTTDGSNPTTSATRQEYSSPFSDDHILIVKAVVMKDGFMYTIVKKSIDLDTHFVMQSAASEYFYITSLGGNDTEGNRVTTTNVPGKDMSWHLVDAEIENNYQYYYFVNDAEGKYLAYTNSKIVVQTSATFTDAADKSIYTFRIVESTVGGFNIYPYNNDNCLKKTNGNNKTNYIELDKNPTNAINRWNFIAVPASPKTLFDDSFASSNDCKQYYNIKNINGNTHYLTPTSTASATTNGSDLVWYFEPASDDEIYTPYYYVRNASTGKYLYYTGSAGSKNMFFMGDSPSDDTYKFVIAHTANTDALNSYNIVPKSLKSELNQFKISMNRNNTDLYTWTSRDDAGSQWNLNSAEFTCATPTITYDAINGKVTMACTTAEAKIYYKGYADEDSYNADTPTLSSGVEGFTLYEDVFAPTQPYYKAIATRCSDNGNDQSGVAGIGPIDLDFKCVTPVITFDSSTSTITITTLTEGATIYYTLDTEIDAEHPTEGTTLYSAPFVLDGTHVIRAIAIKGDASTASTVAVWDEAPHFVSSASAINTQGMGLNYVLNADFSADATIGTELDPFTGTIDGGFHQISLNQPLVTYANNATIRNVIVSSASVSGGNTNGDAGAIVCSATGDTRIYNCGVLSGSVSGSHYVGSIVGLLDGTSRVINCFSYANVSGGTDGGGIVGYNNFASTNTDIKTMVMNCIYYGNVSSCTNISPVYGGEIINNAGNTGLNNYNYYSFEDFTSTITKYNCALGAEKRFLQRFEFYRQILNSNRELAAWYATGSVENARTVMAKWVLDRSIAEYPILKVKGTYPSVINYDPVNTYDATNNTSVARTSVTEANKGKNLGTLTVTISSVGSNAPSGASITTTGSLTLQRTDKDYDNYNFNYDKVQLPYYNEVGTGNYTHNKVVTGWKITAISGGTGGSFMTGTDAPAYNFADRNCTNKDLFSPSGRVFSQGAYFDVPYGVTGITIEPYWGTAAYLADPNYDKTYDTSYNGTDITVMGTRFENGQSYSINGDNQVVYTSMSNAIDALSRDGNVYDYAVVLVGNYHQYFGDGTIKDDNNPFTIMSADLDNDNEPDFSFIYQHTERKNISPIRFDFLCWPGIGMAQKPNGSKRLANIGIFRPRGWFEVTNTCLAHFQEFEYQFSNTKSSPLIFLGGVIEQIVSTADKTSQNTQYIHIGSNAWFKMFCNGSHADKTDFTPHHPISVTGGDYEKFYLSGMFIGTSGKTVNADNAECYISGGRFGEVAGAGMEQVNGDIYWQIYNADIENFFGGGINSANPVTGNITTDIKNSNVTLFCGGPKFGDMTVEKDVHTTAAGSIFGTFFGAGYGGTSYNRVRTRNEYQGTSYNFTTWQGDYTRKYDGDKNGIATNFEYEYFAYAGSGSDAKVGRFYVNYAAVSLANTHDVTSTLTDCTVETNFYGGGNLGAVTGDVTSTLTSTSVKGNAFGAGYSAAAPTVDVMPTSGFVTAPFYDESSGVYRQGVYPAAVTYTWKHADNVSTNNEFDENGGHYILTTVDLSGLGKVTGNVKLTIDGTSVIGNADNTDPNASDEVKAIGNVYGGGEESNVARTANDANATNGNTTVTVGGTTIVSHDVYGGGKGEDDNYAAALVEGNSTVTIQGTPQIYHSVYGGGQLSSVGTFTYDDTKHIASTCTYGGTATVNIYGGTLGRDGAEDGMVYGSSRGDIYAPGEKDKFAWVNTTVVNIGNANGGPSIYGSVYGSGENGHTLTNTVVNVVNGTVGIESGNSITVNKGTANEKTYDGFRYPYRGNVYGGGCGTDTYTANEKTYYNPLSGIVLGNTTVNMTGGYVVRNVYGGGAMGSVGTFTYADEAYHTAHTDVPVGKPYAVADNTGKCTVTISGGVVGPDGMQMTYASGPDDAGHVFGASRGEMHDPADYPNLEQAVYVDTTEVTISGTAFIKGSVYGGSESGHMLHGTWVKIQGGQIGEGEGQTEPYSDWTATSLAECAHWDFDASANAVHYVYDPFVTDDAGNDGKGAYADGSSANYGHKVANNGQTFYGNVFAGGRGYYPYAAGKWLDTAGKVEGSTKLEITGGHILTSIYGGNEMTDVMGNATIEISGGTIGVPREKDAMIAHPVTCYVFGGGKGDQRTWFNTKTNIRGNVTLTIRDEARIFGSVFGGGEDGHVFGDVTTTIGEADEGSQPTIGSTGTSGVDGNIFGGGRGFSESAYTAGSIGGDVNLTINNGTMLGSVFGGGRLASVGAWFVNPDDSKYGTLQDDTNEKTHGHITININGGKIGATDAQGNLVSSSFSIGDVFGGCKGSAQATDEKFGLSKYTDINITGGTIGRNVYGGGEMGGIMKNTDISITGDATTIGGNVYGGGKGSVNNAKVGLVFHDVLVNVEGGTIGGDVYGGGAIADTNYYDDNNTEHDNGSSDAVNCTTEVNLTGGIIKGDAYGGGEGVAYSPANPASWTDDEKAALNRYSAFVWGNVTLTLNGTAFQRDSIQVSGKYIQSSARVFGCNNLNGTPKGSVLVHVQQTKGVTNTGGVLSVNNTKPTLNTGSYELAAVYGGGNLAAYDPQDPAGNGQYSTSHTNTARPVQVVIEGCDATSIESVYGGGNAADVPVTDVLVKSAYELGYVFGGGNGKDKYTLDGSTWVDNPGADVGQHKVYGATTGYGSGNSNTDLVGGYVHEAYGASNEKGTIVGAVNIKTNPDNVCPLCVNKIVGAGKNADINSDVILVMGCMPTAKTAQVIGGADNANVNGNIELTITSGTFGKVFCGNNIGGAVKGHLKLNIEETGCNPIKIDELYLGGNEAAYSIYGYKQVGDNLVARRSADDGTAVDNPDNTDGKHPFPYAEPVLNVISATYIGKVFGGGLGSGAYMYANPTVNINMIPGQYATGIDRDGNSTGDGDAHALGDIGDVYGGGNQAAVYGNTTINIGTAETVTMTSANGEAVVNNEDKTKTVEGARITGNIYGGGNLADVTGDTHINIGTQAYTTADFEGVLVQGNVFGAGKGVETDANKAKVGGNTNVLISGGQIDQNVYGGGQMASVGDAAETADANGHYSTGLATVTINGSASLGTAENCMGEHGKGYVYGSGLGMAGYPDLAYVKNTIVTIGGTAEGDNPAVRGSVFGSGENGHVRHDTKVYVKSGTVGTPLTTYTDDNSNTVTEYAETEGSGVTVFRGNVYGGGRGIDKNNSSHYSQTSGLVAGNTLVEVSGGTIYHGVFGGGSLASVGTTLENGDHAANTGKATVNIKGGIIGDNTKKSDSKSYAGINNGHVYGSGRGVAAGAGTEYVNLAFVHDTEVNIYGADTEKGYAGATIYGCVFGGGANGHVKDDTNVNIYGGTIGTPLTDEEHAETNGEGMTIYRGNVYGGGRGVDQFTDKDGTRFSTTAGVVYGNATVNITGGLIYHDVYGAGSMASVGTITEAVQDGILDYLEGTYVEGTGTTIVNVSGGQIGETGFNDGRVYGAGRGASGSRSSRVAHMEFVDTAYVNISGKADIRGCVFGGGENGHVKNNTKVTISGGVIGTELTEAETTFNTDGTGTTLYRGNVYGGGRGVDHITELGETLSYTAGRVYGNTEVEVTGGTIRHAVYGGGSLASVGKYEVDGNNNITKLTSGGKATVNIRGGLIGNATNPGKNNGNVYGSCRGMVAATSDAQYSKMAFVNNTEVNIYGADSEKSYAGADIRGCVFGGGENGHVFANTDVNIMGGTIGEAFTETEMQIDETTGANSSGHHLYRGNVYGGGRGVDKIGEGNNEHLSATAGRVYGNTDVTVSGGLIRHNVFGGGSLASVGTFTTDKDAEYSHNGSVWTKGGDTYVTISGGTIGQTGTNNGFVFGSGRGMAATSADAHKYAQMAFVNNTHVTISDGTVLGSVFGSGENGHVHNNTEVNVNGGTIGSANCSKFAGNIYGGGRGVDGNAESHMSSTAGWVGNQITVNVTGGTIYHDVYGGGSMGSVGNKDEANTGQVYVNIKGGTVGETAEAAKGYGNVFGGGRGMAGSDYADLAFVKRTFVTIKNDSTSGVRQAHVFGNVYGGGNAGHVRRGTTVTLASGNVDGNIYGGGAGSHLSATAGLVHHNVRVYINGGTVGKNVYGGGQIANTNTHDQRNGNTADCKEICYTKVELNGGLIKGDAYGGGEGVYYVPAPANPDYNQSNWTDEQKATYSTYGAHVYGNVTVTLNGTAFQRDSIQVDSKWIPTSGRIFGCNNYNGSPKGTVLVHVKQTKSLDSNGAVKAKAKGIYELEAVYGGGNLAGYEPYHETLTATGQYTSYTDANSQNVAHDATSKPIQVVIEGCDASSIKYVYGGANAADVPATDVLILGAYEIGNSFGGGNGKEKIKPISTWIDNFGADVGAFWYNRNNYDGTSTVYGSGIATTNVLGGTVHKVYGGSNTKGDIYDHSDLLVDAKTTCALCVDETYGGGNEASSKGGSNIILGCVDYMKEVYAGSTNADINGNVSLTITSGRFDRVFGGNNQGGKIKGSITLNIEETGCNPIIIGELYGGGNQAPYSVYGYNDDGSCKTSGTKQYNDPVVNIRSFTSIGRVFGGGLGATALVYGSPTVNISEVKGVYASTAYAGSTLDFDGDNTSDVTLPGHDENQMGAIYSVFGGGNAANVVGNTTVNVCTTETTQFVTPTSETEANRLKNVEGARIFRDIYGGGNEADIIGNTTINVGTYGAATVGHNVYGGGSMGSVGQFTFDANNMITGYTANTGGKATLNILGGTFGTDGRENGMIYGSSRGDIFAPGENDKKAWVNETEVNIGTQGAATGPQVNGSVYGSGENGRTQADAHVNIHSGSIGDVNETYLYRGNVYGGGCGTDTYTDGGKTYYNRLAGVVRGNTYVNIDGGTVARSVYGGGAMGSVGSFTYDTNGKPTSCAENTGLCTISITGGEIGPNNMKMYHENAVPDDAGHVFGAGRGEMHDPAGYPNLEKVVYVNATDVTIGSDDENVTTTPFVKGSVYGGAESGHVLGDTYVKIKSGQIGNGDGVNRKYTDDEWTTADPLVLKECAHWPYTAGVFTVYDPFVVTVTTDSNGKQIAGQYADETDANGGVKVPQNGQTFYGSVFAGGCGYYPYAAGKWLDSAGLVEGNAKLEMTGGHVLTNVYGGNEMTDVLGNSTVTITGGTVGVPRDSVSMVNHPVTCYVFGGGRGDQRTWFNTKTNIHKNSTLTVTGTARIYGSVYGGGEDGHVFGDTQTTIGDAKVTVADTEQTFDEAAVTIGTLGTSGVDGNVFGSGRGFTVTAYTAGSIGGNATLNINDGTNILGSVYGGGRMASVGSWFVNPGTKDADGNDLYGTLKADTLNVDPKIYHGHTAININGGTIGATDNGVLRTSNFSIGNVYGGCKGTPDAGEHANKFGIAKTTTINMTAGTVNGSVYGGGEAGNILQDTNINITGASAVVKGNVYGGGSEANVGGNTNVVVGQ